jgi:CHAT domain-containing protein
VTSAEAPAEGALTALALRFILCTGLTECSAFLHANPGLVSREGVEAVRGLAGAALRDADAERLIRDRAELLARCEEIGIDAAFLERGGSAALVPESLAPMFERVHQAQEAYLDTRRADTIAAFVTAAQAVVQHPDLVAAPAAFRARCGAGLAHALLERYSLTRDGADLDSALGMLKRAVELIEPSNPDMVNFAQLLVHASSLESARTGDARMARYAVGHLRAALREAQWRDHEAAELQSLLCIALRITSEHGGDPQWAAEAADAGLLAIELAPPGSTELPLYQRCAGEALWVRYNQTADTTDLVRALQLLEAANDGAQGTSIEASVCALFAHAVRDHYLLTDDSRTLDLLIRLRYRVVELARDGDEEAAENLSYLGVALHYRYGVTESQADLDAAIEYCERGVRERADHRLKSRLICDVGLAVSLMSRWRRDRDPRDVDRVIELYERLLEDAPVAAAAAKSNLANALAERAELHGNDKDARDAARLFREGAGRAETGLVVALTAALRWARRAIEISDWEEAAEASQAALALLSNVLRLQRTWDEKSVWLRRAQSLSAWAAYSLGKLGRPWDAVLALESGRGRWLTESMQLEAAELEGLRDGCHAGLRDRYRAALGVLTTLEEQADPALVAAPDAGRRAAQRRAALAELEDAIAAIQRVPGYEDFGRAPRREVIREAATGPICYLVPSLAGGLALIVREDAGEPETVWLPQLNEDHLAQQTTRLGHALAGDDEHADDAVHELTYWLWDAVMAPVLANLTGAAEICLIATSWLSFWPLHAAATIDASSPTGHRYAIDQLCVTYAANARARRRSLELQRHMRGELTALVVADPQPTSAEPLQSARTEAEAIARRLPASVLQGPAATKAGVRDQLTDHGVLHFACHGAANLMTPLTSRLLLAHDEPLFLADLLGARLNARLAVLSACQSAWSGGIVDEVVALPTGLLQAGVAGSLATMWTVADATAAVLMTCFYAEWIDRGQTPAEALRSAQRWVRDTTNDEKAARFPECRELLHASSAHGDEPWGARREYGHPADWAAFALFGL